MMGRLLAALAWLAALACGCGGRPLDPARSAVDRVARSLAQMQMSPLGTEERRAAQPAAEQPIDEEHLRDLLADALRKDAYQCLPAPQAVLSPPAGDAPERTIEGVVPHYSFFHGPMRYRVRAAGGLWRVSVHVAVAAEEGGTLELPDCTLHDQMRGELVCRGVAYDEAPGVEACPDSGRFEAPASRHNLRVLLRRWSRDAERYFNRDARHFGLPVRYDFELFLVDDGAAAVEPIDVRLPLWPSCGRTPYFMALRSGWSLPVLAHELGHYLGLLDEYQALSGIFSFYPKTPFEGSEGSRMGLSMKRHTRVWPLHHYLVLRRYHCPEPHRRDPYGGVLQP